MTQDTYTNLLLDGNSVIKDFGDEKYTLFKNILLFVVYRIKNSRFRSGNDYFGGQGGGVREIVGGFPSFSPSFNLSATSKSSPPSFLPL